jgi:hypothetical protein
MQQAKVVSVVHDTRPTPIARVEQVMWVGSAKLPFGHRGRHKVSMAPEFLHDWNGEVLIEVQPSH